MVRRIEVETVDSGASILLPLVVLCETVWVLGSLYRFDRTTIAGALEAVMDDALFKFENLSLAREALGRYRAARGDFADYIIQGQWNTTYPSLARGA